MPNSENKICQSCHNSFVIDAQDFQFYEKIKVPAPTFCPECRLIRRIITYNRRTLYKSNCGLCGKQVFSIYSPKEPLKTFCNKCWWSDQWEGKEYARDYDFSKPFFEQFHELMLAVPWMALGTDAPTMVNSDYCNAAGHLKNCYLVFYADYAEDSAYCDGIANSKNCFDVLLATRADFSYDCFNLTRCNNTFFSVDSEDCYDIWFSKDMRGCSNCFGCTGLRNKKYHFFNEPLSKNEYEERLKAFDTGSCRTLGELRERAQQFWLAHPTKYIHSWHSSNVSGDYIEHSKNVHHSFQIEHAENCKYCTFIYLNTKDAYDYTSWGNNAELIYDCQGVGENVAQMKFSCSCWPSCFNLEYCMYCLTCRDCFACIGLRNKSYCILNKQYTKEEYEELVPRIIEHMNKMPYISRKSEILNPKSQINSKSPSPKFQTREIVYRYGEFFPPELSPFAYNETIAQEYFPLTKEQAIEKGYRWKDPELRNYSITKLPQDLPDHIKDVSDSILTEVIQCQHTVSQTSADYTQTNAESQRESASSPRMSASCTHQCTTAFKIIPQELQFYRRMNLPLPRLCPNCRHYQRLKQRNPLKLWHRKCMCNGQLSLQLPITNYQYQNTISHFHGSNPCPNEFETTYAPNRPEIVYCEACYNTEVV